MRHLVAVADHRHRDHRPPETVRDAFDLRLRMTELGVVERRRVDEHADGERDEEHAQIFDARLERQDEDQKSDGVLRQLEDADEADDALERQNSARLDRGARVR